MVESSQLILDLPSLCSFHKCLVNESFLANVFPHKLHNRFVFLSSRFLGAIHILRKHIFGPFWPFLATFEHLWTLWDTFWAHFGTFLALLGHFFDSFWHFWPPPSQLKSAYVIYEWYLNQMAILSLNWSLWFSLMSLFSSLPGIRKSLLASPSCWGKNPGWPPEN